MAIPMSVYLSLFELHKVYFSFLYFNPIIWPLSLGKTANECSKKFWVITLLTFSIIIDTFVYWSFIFLFYLC